ncbi:MAG: VWA domain-containing protein [Rhodobacteraceae bacterium]|nr:VWA domain-containing protein [Paracoccaceae bacterium]
MFKRLTLASLVAASFTGVAAQEMPYPDTIVILDVSNSMWGQIDGVAKIEIARTVLSGLVDGLETDSEFGLMAYGHNNSDCGNIEMVLPVGPLDAGQFANAVNSLTPHGRTPLVAAVDQAADALQYKTRSARIVLVTDGVESCGGDLKSLADALGSDSLDFTAHVIAFDVVDAGKQAELGYLAEQTGGLFVSADSTAELKAALQSMMGDMDGTPMDATAETMGESMISATLSAPEETGPRSRIMVDFTGPMAGGDYIGLSNAGAADDAVLAAAMAGSSGSALLIAPRTPGSYELRYYTADGEVLAIKAITVR